MLILLITVLLSGGAILIAGAVTSSLQVSDFGTAGFTFIENFVLFFVVGFLMSGITIRGFLGPLLAIVLMTLIDVFVPQALISAGIAF